MSRLKIRPADLGVGDMFVTVGPNGVPNRLTYIKLRYDCYVYVSLKEEWGEKEDGIVRSENTASFFERIHHIEYMGTLDEVLVHNLKVHFRVI